MWLWIVTGLCGSNILMEKRVIQTWRGATDSRAAGEEAGDGERRAGEGAAGGRGCAQRKGAGVTAQP